MDGDVIGLAELVPAGGSWAGLLFDNPLIGLSPALTWTFSFEFAEVEREDGGSPVGVDLDWVPLPGATWRDMAGRTAAATAFHEPFETSAYFFEHHRFDRAHLHIVEQRGTRLRVVAAVAGDIDGFGHDSLDVDGELEFEGIRVALHDLAPGVEAARERLAAFTDPSGLVGRVEEHNVLFAPRPHD